MNILILDASIFIQGITLPSGYSYYSVPSVLNEVRDEIAKLRIEVAISSRSLTILQPDEQWIREVETISKSMGESNRLSLTDKLLLALALQLRSDCNNTILISDDYSVQNIADKLVINYRSYSTRGIKRRIEWLLYCPGCRRIYNEQQPQNACQVCGTQLKIKPRKLSHRGG